MESIDKVVAGNYCVGCGACAHYQGGSMKLNEFGEYLPDLAGGETRESLDQVCPFLHPEQNEDVLSKERFGTHAEFDSRIGYNIQSYGAYVIEDDFRESGTSGGMGTWIGVELMRRGWIDGVIHAKAVKREGSGDPFFRYAISRDETAVREGARTRYHVMEMTEVLQEVQDKPGRYLFIGVPCFCKAVRRLQKVDEVLAERICFVVALVCGHYKSINWTLSLGWGAGVAPSELAEFRYRCKGPGISARAYVFRATPKQGEAVQMDSADVVGGKFNAGAMMLNACDYCDDIVGETADLTIGDAWLPKFDVHRGGTNLLIARNPQIHSVLEEAGNEGRLFIEKISADEAAASQSGGFRQRRDGLSHRLSMAQKEGRWAPEKRVKPDSVRLSPIRKRIYESRVKCAQASRSAFVEALEKNDYTVYTDAMRTVFKRLRRVEMASSFFRVMRVKLERIFRKLTQSS